MKKRSIALIIWLMSIALIAVMAMQYYFVRESFRQKSKIFDDAVKASLATVANKLEQQEIYDFAQEQERKNQKRFIENQKKQEQKQLNLAKQVEYQERIKKLQTELFDYEQRFNDAENDLNNRFMNIPITNEFFETYIRNKPNPQLYIWLEKIQMPDGGIRSFPRVDAVKESNVIQARDDSSRYIIPNFLGGVEQASSFRLVTLRPKTNNKIISSIIQLEKELVKMNSVNLDNASSLFDSVAVLSGKKSSVVQDAAFGLELTKRPLEQRLNRQIVKQLLVEELAERGINSSFVLQVKTSKNSPLVFQEVHLINNEDFEKINNPIIYKTKLFQGDQGKSPGELGIYFPNKDSIIASNMGYWLFPTILALLGLLIGSFAYTLMIIFRQKKISEMKTDFINNMTHEFKTPVATIMIASESLRDPEISSDEKRVNKLANIIYDENVRLGSHIERVLNIARLEKENLKIERVNVHINTLANGVLESMKLQLEKAGGTLEINLDAKKDIVIGDELHLSNVMYNLVDNAIKYSKEKPEITFRTLNRGKNIVISVSDKGIGMTKDQAEKIFDQFYRIPTGNIHNVKGFGLGLSYVNDIIKRLNGRITVKSEKDKGTQFEVILPLRNS